MKGYVIHLTSRAEKDLKKLSPQLKERIIKAIQSLATDQHSLQSKSLRGNKLAQYRMRVGDYRILYDIYPQDKTVLILRLGHRREIYR